MDRSFANLAVQRAEQVVHAVLPLIAARIACRKMAANRLFAVFGLRSNPIEFQRKAAKHRTNNPAGHAIRQQQSGGALFVIADLAPSDQGKRIDFNPSDRVADRGHLVPFPGLRGARGV